MPSTSPRTSRKRIGNFWLDSFNFYRETDVTGWSFNALSTYGQLWRGQMTE